MKTYLLSPCISMIDSIAAELTCDGRDYSMNLVVFPGKRPAHFLRKTVAEMIKGCFVPPVILSMDEFIDMSYLSARDRRKIDPLDAVAMLYDIHREANDRIGGQAFNTLDAFLPIGLKLYHDLEELTIEQVSVQRLRETGLVPAENMYAASQQRMETFEEYYRRFYREIESAGLSTRALRYRTVAEASEQAGISSFRRILFGGFFALTVSEKKIYSWLAGMENTVLFFQDGPHIMEMLRSMKIEPEVRKADDRIPEFIFTASPDSHGQVFALADILGPLHESGGLDEKDAVVLPAAESLFPLIRHGLPDLEENEYNISLGYPLVRTPMFGFVHALMETIAASDGERMYMPAYLSFMLHPYTKNIYFGPGAEYTRILFHSVEEYYSGHAVKIFVALDEIEADAKLLSLVMERLPQDDSGITADAVRAHLISVHSLTIRPFLNIKDINDFSCKCMDVFTFLAGHSTAPLHPLFSPFCEAFMESLETVNKSLIGLSRFEDISGYFNFFRRYLTTRHVPFKGTPVRGLQVLGMLETRGIRFDRLFIIDANESMLPAAGREDSLLPGRARELLGLPTYHDRERLAEYYFDVLVRGAREVSFFFIENEKEEKSRFVEKILWELQQRDRMVESKRYVRSLQYRVHLGNNIPEPVRKSEETVEFLKHFSYSASALDMYLACPLRFYYHFVAGISARQEAPGEIERSDIGILVHEALAEYFRPRRGRVLREVDIRREEIIEISGRTMERMFGEKPSGRGYLVMKQVQRRLGDYLDKYCLPLIRESAVIAVDAEKRIKASFMGFQINGKIDAVQRRDDRLFVLDYKTSANKSAYRISFSRLDPENRQTWSSVATLQLPLYRILCSHEMGVERGRIEALFLMLGMTQINKSIEIPLFPDEGRDCSALSQTLDRLMFLLMSEIADSSVPFSPTQDLKKNCSGCNYSFICGTQWAAR